MKSVLLVGAGKMGMALHDGWRKNLSALTVTAIDPATPGCLPSPAGLTSPDAIVFAVKPQTLPNLIKDYKPLIAPGTIILSIAAGIPLAFFERHLGADVPIIRAMPNLPAAIGRGITVACANKNATPHDRATIDPLLSAIGETVWIENEELLNPVTALSGSGPAYVFLLIETLTKAGIRIGLDASLAQKLARQTIIGSAHLAAESPDDAAQLRRNVTSPGGTTEAALNILMKGDALQKLFDEALEAAMLKARALSQQQPES